MCGCARVYIYIYNAPIDLNYYYYYYWGTMKLEPVPPKRWYLRNYVLHIPDDYHTEWQKSVNNLPEFKQHFAGCKSITVWMECRSSCRLQYIHKHSLPPARSSANCNRFWGRQQPNTHNAHRSHLYITQRSNTGRFKRFADSPVSLHCRCYIPLLKKSITHSPQPTRISLCLRFQTSRDDVTICWSAG